MRGANLRHSVTGTRFLVLALLGVLALGGSAYAMLSSHGASLSSPVFTAGPRHLTVQTSATFRFVHRGRAPSHGGHPDRVVLQCSFAHARFRACTSPVGFSRLGNRWHTFRVRAMDARTGTLSGLATYRWLVDDQPPTVSLAFPANGGAYDQSSWNTGCRQGPGLCGDAHARSGVRSVAISIREGTGGKWWGGHGFNQTHEVFLAARWSAGWHYPLAVPAGGAYTVRVRATNRLGRTTTGTAGRVPARGSSYRDATAAFTIVEPASQPDAPQITGHPADPTSSTSATFTFTTAQAGVQFACSVDGGARTVCSSPATYGPLSPGAHHFEVVALDGAGRSSAVAAYAWTISPPPGVPFTITGDAPGPLYPGAAAQTLAVTLHNPGNASITVTSLTAALSASSLPAGCDGAWFQFVQSTVSSTTPVQVPANGSVSLPAQGARAPSLEMTDSHSNQDACANAHLQIAYSGSAHS